MQGVDTSRGTKEQTRSKEVLLADDDDAFRETLAIWLARTGSWSVREARDGTQALEKLDESVDVLVLDRQMPELSGPEVVERLHETPFDGEVVVLSAYEPDDYLCGDDVGAYLTKPVDREGFVELLEATLDGAA